MHAADPEAAIRPDLAVVEAIHCAVWFRMDKELQFARAWIEEVNAGAQSDHETGVHCKADAADGRGHGVGRSFSRRQFEAEHCGGQNVHEP